MLICLRCGAEDTNGKLAKRVERNTSQLCSSCRARPSARINSTMGKCIPHKGEFDLNTNQPLDENGNLFMPGTRLCGNADCCEPDHIERAYTPEVFSLEMERISISYRTGVQLSPQEQFKMVTAEYVKRKKLK